MTDQYEHPWDLPDYDVTAKGSIKGFIALIVLVIAVGIGTYLMGKWLEPPVVVFRIEPVVTRTVQVTGTVGNEPDNARIWDTAVTTATTEGSTTCTINRR